MGSAGESSLEPEVNSTEWLVEEKILKASKYEISLHPPYFWRRMILRSVGQWIRITIMWHQIWYDQILSLARDGVALCKSNNSCHHRLPITSKLKENSIPGSRKIWSSRAWYRVKLLLFSSTAEEIGHLWGIILCSVSRYKDSMTECRLDAIVFSAFSRSPSRLFVIYWQWCYPQKQQALPFSVGPLPWQVFSPATHTSDLTVVYPGFNPFQKLLFISILSTLCFLAKWVEFCRVFLVLRSSWKKTSYPIFWGHCLHCSITYRMRRRKGGLELG